MTSSLLCKLYKTVLKEAVGRKIQFSLFQWKNVKLSPEKTRITHGKHSYTRSYPQYSQNRTTSVVQEKCCQVRMFVLEFVIKSQIKGEKQMSCRDEAFLDKWHCCKNLPVNAWKQGKEMHYWNNEKNKRTIIIFFIKLYLLF